MRSAITVIASLLACASTLAAGLPPVTLNPMQGDEKVAIENSTSVTGSCGGAVVRLLGAMEFEGEHFSADPDGKIIVRPGVGKELVLDANNGVLSDFNGLGCLQTKEGWRLLVWSKCAGSACPDTYTFFVVDPDRAAMVAPRNPAKGRCDEACATRLLGSSIPMRLNGK